MDEEPNRVAVATLKFLLLTGLLGAAGIENLRIHDLRHSFASLAVNARPTRYHVQHLLGHASSQTTQRYAHLADTALG